MRIAFLGAGKVGGALAAGLAAAGHECVVAARDSNSESTAQALARHPKLRAAPIAEAVADAEAVFLATPYTANRAALDSAGELAGKIVVDCTNPIGPGFTLLLGGDDSGGEETQRLRPEARVVKAFTIYGYENFENSAYPGYGDLRPAMLLCGNHSAAREAVSGLAADLGWEPVVAGDIRMSRCLEPMTLLWIQMARVQGRGPDFVWAMLRR